MLVNTRIAWLIGPQTYEDDGTCANVFHHQSSWVAPVSMAGAIAVALPFALATAYAAGSR
ncbi:MAG: hypothetical protein MUC47_01975 [Candidatus Kapabacteria bacterium]|nr:hypothetical protein [Candidatus Kapabacteria bacterium]